jgi:aspartyl-tRNA(Asn)/glutamyl-tRNA(Gln) amidotransferase subunit C
MEINIDKVAELARLNLKAEEKKKLSQDLGAILEYVKKLDKLDTSKVEPTSHVLNMENVFRADEVKSSNAAEKALEHAPLTEGPFFKVPKIVQR